MPFLMQLDSAPSRPRLANTLRALVLSDSVGSPSERSQSPSPPDNSLHVRSYELSRRHKRGTFVAFECPHFDARDQFAAELGGVGNRVEAAY